MKRNADGLVEGVEYKFREDGTIDWRAMVEPKYLVPNKDKFPNLNKEELDQLKVTALKDSELLIKLDGIKKLARLRGFTSVNQHVDYVSEEKAVSTCSITWIACKDSSGLVQTFSDTANASTRNCNDFGVLFLEPIAANRAFVRAVRNYLGIEILGADEVSGVPYKEDARPTNAQNTVEVLCSKLSWDFETFLDKAKSKYNVELWKSWKDIPNEDAVTLIASLKKITKKVK